MPRPVPPVGGRLIVGGLALASLLFLPHPAVCLAAGPLNGSVVATAGDVNGDGFSDVLVGIPTASPGGEVDVYLGSVDGSLTLQRQLNPFEGNSNFGAAVACAGDVNGDGYDDIVIGQPLHTGSSPVESGQVWIFLGGPTGIGPSPQLKIEGFDPLGHFGAAVSTAGDVNGDGYDDVVVGAPDSPGAAGPGAQGGQASIYLGSASGLSPTPQLVVNGNSAIDHVGASVSGGCDLNGDGYDDVILGAPFTGGGANGKILLVRGSAGGAVFVTSDQLSGPIDSFGFGSSVAEVGDWNGDGYADVVVGAPQSNAGAFSACGKAYLVPCGVGGLPAVPTLLMTGNQNNESVGQWVACAGDRNGDGLGDLAIGAPGASGPLGANQGYVAVRYGMIIVPAIADTLYGPAAGARAGACFSGAGELAGNGFADLAIASPQVGLSGQVNFFPGRVIAPERAVDAFTATGGDSDTFFGWAVAEGGDLNGDGYGDVLVGAPGQSVTVLHEGGVSIYTGFRGNANSNVNVGPVLHGGQSGSRFGTSVDFAGDVNGDGYDDVVVGAPGDSHALPGAGRASLYYGRAAGVDTVAAWTADGTAPGDSLGFSACGAGDLNRDGYADIAVSTPDAGGGAGQVRIYHGSPVGPTSTPAQVLTGAAVGDSLGYRVAPAGDVNGDGYDDLLIGAPGHNSSVGEALVLYGGPSGPGSTAVILPSEGGPGQHFGAALAGRADLDLDGIADVAIGAPSSNVNGPGTGLVEIHRGSLSGLSTGATQLLLGSPAGALFGTCLSFGDYDADGRSDLGVGAPGIRNNPVYSPFPGNGAVYMCKSGSDGVLTQLNPSVRFRVSADSDGVAFSLAGDLNGDGFADLTDADPYWGGATIGVMQTFDGGGQRQSIERLPRARRAGSTGPLAFLGGVNSSEGFALALRARTPAGRQRLKVQWQAGPAATPFSALPVQSIGPVMSSAPDSIGSLADMSWNVNGIPAGTPVHWRMRVKSHAGIFAYTPWLTPAANASTLADLDVIASPVGVTPLGSSSLALAAPSPNPSRGAVALTFAMPHAGEASLAVFDPRGRLVRELVRGRLPAGPAEATWDGSDGRGSRVGAGVYFALLRVGQETAARRIVRLP